MMTGECMIISPEHVVGACAERKAAGCRFVTMTCVELDEKTLEVLYHFEKDQKLQHLRLSVAKDTCLPSITAVYFAAFLVENEIQDLFGLRFSGLAIDYNRSLYLEQEVTRAPFCKYTVGDKGQIDKPLGEPGPSQ
jgi:ech hydrogenase subunit D